MNEPTTVAQVPDYLRHLAAQARATAISASGRPEPHVIRANALAEGLTKAAAVLDDVMAGEG